MGKVINMEDRRAQSEDELWVRIRSLQERASALRVLGNKEKTLGPFIEADELDKVKDELLDRVFKKYKDGEK